MAKFLHVGKVKPNKSWHNNYYVHPYHELIVVLNGIMHIDDGNEKITLSAEESALYPAGVYHREQSDPDYPVESFFFVFEDKNLQSEKISCKSDAIPLLKTMATTFWELHHSETPVSFADEYISLMLQLFFFKQKSVDKNFVNIADDFMSKHLSSDISLDDIAAAAKKSKYLFLRQYHEETGITPIKKLWQMRCEEAVALLKYTALSTKEIAFRTGFADTGHFCRKIKNFCGKTPVEIRNSTH